MLWLNPTEATLDGAPLPGVRSVAVDRVTTRTAEERTDAGPHVVFSDAPEQRVTLRLRRRVAGADDAALPGVPLGAMAALAFRAAPSSGDRNGRRISATVALRAVEHGFTAREGFTQTLTMTAISPDGAADPITEEGESP